MGQPLSSNFNYDNAQEFIITKYIYENYFLRHYDKKMGWTSQLVVDKETQLSGADIISYQTPFLYRTIDLKAQATYINSPTNTFAFEIMYGGDKEGWLINNNLKTTCYGLVWIWDAVKAQNIQANDILLTEFMMLNKRMLLKLLNDNGITPFYMKKVAKFMVDHGIDRIKYGDKINAEINIPKSDICQSICFTKSSQLYENPVNIVIRKDILLKICDSICIFNNKMFYENKYIWKNYDKNINKKGFIKNWDKRVLNQK